MQGPLALSVRSCKTSQYVESRTSRPATSKAIIPFTNVYGHCGSAHQYASRRLPATGRHPGEATAIPALTVRRAPCHAIAGDGRDARDQSAAGLCPGLMCFPLHPLVAAEPRPEASRNAVLVRHTGAALQGSHSGIWRTQCRFLTTMRFGSMLWRPMRRLPA